jgi:choice-of-anchor B domain-containing protein
MTRRALAPPSAAVRPLLGAGIVLAALVAAPAAASAQARNVQFLSHPTGAWTQYSACWSYVHPDGREYAALGTNQGTAIYRLTNPAAPVLVTHIPGPTSQWREMKQYRNWLYVVSEGQGTGAGLQVIRMTNPDAPVLAATYTATFLTAHTVTIDTTNAILYANGTRLSTGVASGLKVLSLANPEAPVQLASYTGPYVHDSHVRDGRLYTSHISEGWFRVFDVSNPANLGQPGALLSAKTFSNPFPHNAWTSPDHKFLYVTNENNEGLMKTFDISDLDNIVQTASYRAVAGAICHNVHNRGDTLFASHYTEGVRLLDIADPARPVEWGYYDTYGGTGTGFFGNWEVCSDYPSGIFIASDMQTGLWVFRPAPNYGIVGGRVVDGSGAPVAGAAVHLHAGNHGGSASALTSTSDVIGRFRVALDPGAYEFEAHRFGYEDGGAGGTMAAGATDSVVIVMERIPFAAVEGGVTAAAASPFAAAGAGLDGTELHVDDSPLDTVSVAAGAYRIGEIPVGQWFLHAIHPAYVPEERSIGIVAGADEIQDFALVPVAFYDPAEVTGAWSLFTTGDNATVSGRWENGNPNGTGSAALRSGGGLSLQSTSPSDPPIVHHPDHDSEAGAGPGPVAPEDDHSPGARVNCFVTGLGAPGAAIGEHDVDTGRTTLTSPAFDLGAIADPVVAWYQWYVNDGNSSVDDAFVVQVSNNNGATWVHVDSTTAPAGRWQRRTMRVASFVAPTSAMRVRFIAADTGAGSVVEAGIDDLAYYAAPATVGVPGPFRGGARRAVGSVAPNPSQGSVRLGISGPAGTSVSVSVHDVRGRVVARLADVPLSGGTAEVRWDGRDHAGRTAPAGIYLVRATAGRERATARLVRLAP